MFGLVIALALLLAGAAFLAFELLRPLEDAASLDLNRLRADYGRPDPYAPMARLLAEADEVYIRTQRPVDKRLQARFRRQRRKALKLYVNRLRVDFSPTWRLCRLLAPINEDQEFAVRLMRAAIVFQGTFLIVKVALLFGADGLVRDQLAGLAQAGAHLRESAHNLVEAAASWSPAAAAAS